MTLPRRLVVFATCAILGFGGLPAARAGDDPPVGKPPRAKTEGETGPEVRAGLRVLGRVILSYLAAKDDPAKASVYEAVMRALAEAFLAGREGGDEGMKRAGAAVLAEVFAAVNDKKKAEVAAELLKILREEAKAAAEARRARTGVDDGTDLETEWQLGGARVRPDAGEAPRTVVLGLREVPAESDAAKAGFAAGDVILAVDGRPIGARGVSKVRKAFEGGRPVAVTVLRRGGKRDVFEVAGKRR